MSIVIIGGNDRMVRKYRDICTEYNHVAKIYTQPKCNLECLIGCPDLIVLFTHPVSHEMVRIAKKKAARDDIAIVQSHCGSGNALRCILNEAGKTVPAAPAP
ncbi:MAG: DUF2325 domain-containing protein [Oscillospiraceae bacterium]|nr:DUF2325 domain-containing protein [Oscillospiraceae bacterium]